MRRARRGAAGPPVGGAVHDVPARPDQAHGRGRARPGSGSASPSRAEGKRYQTPDDPDGDFNGAVPDQAFVDEAWAAWRAEIAFADEFIADHDFDFVGKDSQGEPVSLRELIVHMIEEYARHNGHADLLRERIDGRVGQ